jgi:hypothetical protein
MVLFLRHVHVHVQYQAAFNHAKMTTQNGKSEMAGEIPTGQARA